MKVTVDFKKAIHEICKNWGNNPTTIMLEAEIVNPIEGTPEWEKKLDEEWSLCSKFAEGLILINPEGNKRFIRNEILSKFAEECRVDPNKWGAELVNNRVNDVLKRWMGGTK